MSFDAELWREVALHLELAEATRRLARLTHRVVPIDALLIRKLEREPLRLTTLACATRSSGKTPEPELSRTDCEQSAEPEVTGFLSQGRAIALKNDALAQSLLPAGLSGAVIAGPLTVGGVAVGVALFVAQRREGFSDEHVLAAEALLEPISVAFENDQRLQELSRMREALEVEREALLSRLGRKDLSDTIVGAEIGLRQVMERVDQVARTDAPVLLLGETGSGKEVIARAIHARSERSAGPVVRVNCGAIPSELVDSELFGHEKGAFTGAVATRKGWFERADGGTLFLDEIGELPMAAQVRLLRVLQDGSLERVGGARAITVDVRIVAATHRKLEAMVAKGTFREDLWYRISVFPVRIPPLRERVQDIPQLAAHFARRAGLRLGTATLLPSARDLQLLAAYPWPGNVRELAAVLERAAILGDGKRLEVETALGVANIPSNAVATLASNAAPHAAPAAPAATVPVPSSPALDDAMRAHIEQVLERVHGRIEGPFGAARQLDINPHTLRARMRKLGIDWSKYRGGA